MSIDKLGDADPGERHPVRPHGGRRRGAAAAFEMTAHAENLPAASRHGQPSDGKSSGLCHGSAVVIARADGLITAVTSTCEQDTNADLWPWPGPTLLDHRHAKLPRSVLEHYGAVPTRAR